MELHSSLALSSAHVKKITFLFKKLKKKLNLPAITMPPSILSKYTGYERCCSLSFSVREI